MRRLSIALRLALLFSAIAAAVFVAVQGASSYTFAEATSGQDLPNWIGSHMRAWEFFGGVSEVVVPDNLKSAVTHPSYYEPDLNPTYRDLGEHYGVAILPAAVDTGVVFVRTDVEGDGRINLSADLPTAAMG